MIKKYCKAYHLKDLRQFRGWTEYTTDQETDLFEEDIVYLWDDFTVVRSPVISEKGLVFDTVTTEWQDFCKTTLHFEIPEDLHYAYKQTEGQVAMEETEKTAST